MGFIGYLHSCGESGDDVVRIFLECREEGEADDSAADSPGEPPRGISYTYAVDVIFPAGQPPCRLRGVDGVLELKKFYKLVHSLEERAREHGNAWQAALGSVEGLLEHLGYTRNARDFTLGQPRPGHTGSQTAS